MRAKLVCLVVIAVCMLWGCTGCESENATVDVTQDRAILTGSRWIAQESYIIGSKQWRVMAISQSSETNNLFQVSMYPNTTTIRSNQSGTIVYEGEHVEFSTIVSGIQALYTVKITIGPDGSVVCTLTDSDSRKMFFSPEPALNAQ